jgi:predicted acyltransferase
MSQPVSVPGRRVHSIDALRGFDMFWIMGGEALFSALLKLVNTPWAAKLSLQFDHSEWNGFTFYDLIFPLFLFIVGASIPFAMAKRLESGSDKKTLYKHILVRTAKLIFFGFLVNGLLNFTWFSSMRWAGVLQRIGISYGIASIIAMNSKPKTQGFIFAGILVAYWLAMILIPVPGFGAGNLTPEANLASYLDRLLLPGRFCCFSFGDNEGLLSTLPAVSTCLMGVLTGHWLRSSATKERKALYMVIAGLTSLGLALIWDLVFPINKLIWTSSYVLFAGGWSLLLLSLFYWIIDVKGLKGWSFPFMVIGMNAITIYLVQALFRFNTITDIFVHGFIDQLGDYRAAFYIAATLCVKWLFLYFLYRQKIFLKA